MNGMSGFTSQLRLTGFSGFDTESIVSQLMKAEKIPLDALRQKRTLVEWKQEAYREVSSTLKGFQTKFFDIVNRSTYMLSENSIKPMAAKSSNNAYVTASGTAQASAGTQTIRIQQLATADTMVSSGTISKDISGSIATERNLAGKRIYVNLDGVTKTIALKDYTEYTETDIQADIQNSLNNAFGTDKLKVTVTGGKISIGTQPDSGVTKVTLSEPSDGTGGLSGLGITFGASNRISLNSKLESVVGGPVSIRINGELITANANETLGQLFDKINNSPEANARISYDEITDTITLKSKQTGDGDNLLIQDTGANFLSAFKLDNLTNGQDAIVYINDSDVPLVRSSNNFTVNGINYTLNKAHEDGMPGETITVEQDTETVIKNIKSFIDEYNKLIESLNTKTKESYDRDYLPLTDEQKEAMEEKDIENWEKRAKTGLLRNDSILQQIINSMRRALYEKVEGSALALKDIGIESRSYMDNGKLYLDEDKLKEVLLKNPDGVTKLLNGVSENNPTYSRDLTPAQRQDRFSKSGVFQRIADIIEDNISTKRNKDNKKGILLEKAGIEGDLSVTKNLMYEELERYDDRIDDLIDILIRKEENYYKKFSRLETMLSQMNQQSAWIASQFSFGQ